MFAPVLRRAVASRAISSAAPLQRAVTATRAASQRSIFACSFSSESSIKRPKAMKIKKSEARRRVEPKAKETDALVEQPEHAQAPAEYQQNPFLAPQEPQTLGGAMKQSFLWGFGMAIAFAFVGVIFGRMEEVADAGVYMDGSHTHIVATAETHEDEKEGM